jgi:hypothetical protein
VRKAFEDKKINIEYNLQRFEEMKNGKIADIQAANEQKKMRIKSAS